MKKCPGHFLLADHGKEHYDGQQKNSTKKACCRRKIMSAAGFFD